ncbi:MAG: LapA family protein [Deltaproteobacteria bacterium]|nr:LapA family protein [Deltaproteobacteria bacterium]
MIKIILAIFLVIVGATFCALNRQEITLRYFFGWNTVPFPLFLLILASLVAGGLVGFLVGWRERWKLRGKGRDLGERLKALKNEIESLLPKEESPEPSPKAPEGSKTPIS